MLSKTKFLLPVIAGALLLQSCDKKDEFYTTADGLTYKIYEKNDEGEYENKGKVSPEDTTGAKVGEVVTMHMMYKNAADSVLFDSRTQNQPIMIPVMEPTFKGSLEHALMMMSAGDSGVFKVNADSLFAKTFNQPLPPFIKPGTDLTFFIKADKIQSRDAAIADQQKMFEEQMKEAQVRAEKQIKVDDQKIQEYVKTQNLSGMQKTESGVYYKVNTPGKGPQAAAGDQVSVHYKLSSLDGKEMESSYNNPMTGGEPFTFTLGQGQVIRGWDEAIQKLKEGSKATLIVPSPLAYGEQDRGPEMPANSILRFDIELVKVNKQ
ncbi:FKBP-type peptidyl-prolyl cis-trans isomerase [Pontibacter cellulosilyticus]|uniref:Peptidyl-prolyl cis-trans isomerase n=1 Tax=Pontibacter cellulosilyticus TaxID=1720253 RepID=A0A923N6U1_9BACT|nr:FKBP-type peptidyl-prolyl cis-trans isomerase [Pontibacter cellulosilyticus]MBC5992817.1 FKBP-type peptidyl-prolyl cis-trans isomerase [Pontibacter cellulosilyticus]